LKKSKVLKGLNTDADSSKESSNLIYGIGHEYKNSAIFCKLEATFASN